MSLRRRGFPSCNRPDNIVQPPNCRENICGGMTDATGDICVPSSSNIQTCLETYETSGTLPTDCICEGGNPGFDIYILNKSSTTLALTDVSILSNSISFWRNGFDGPPDECKNGVWIVSPATSIEPGKAVFMRAWPGNQYKDKCDRDTQYDLAPLYENASGGKLAIFIQTRRQKSDTTCNDFVRDPSSKANQTIVSGNLQFDTSFSNSNTFLSSGTQSIIVTDKNGGNGGNGKLSRTYRILIITIVAVFVFVIFFGIIYVAVA